MQILSTGKMSKLRITNENGRLTKEEIEKMIKDAENYKREDEEYKKKVNAFNALEDCIYNMKKKIKNMAYGVRLNELEHVIADTTKWMENHQDTSVDKVQAMKEYLESICMREFLFSELLIKLWYLMKWSFIY
ncbi:unnamed protein product [Lactuca virosa]|uniref:Heat shock protein 70 n=1 Tax=Lactuca virosa TaxID=75947 RepID=A0AAU9LU14_9ASTR|nr:unnamed protein product [Lactuca virosa]